MYEQLPTGAEAREEENQRQRNDTLSKDLERIIAEEEEKERKRSSTVVQSVSPKNAIRIESQDSQVDTLQKSAEKQATPEAIIEELRPELQSLAYQMKQGIVEGRWDSIVGDEVSARLPTLFMHRLLQRYAQEHGTRDPRVVFMAGDRDRFGSSKTAMEEYIASRREDIGQRTLLVTEYVTSGDVLYDELSMLPTDTVKDVAILRVDSNGMYDEQSSVAQRGGLVMVGGRMASQAQMLHNEALGKAMSGVQKRHIQHTDEVLIESEGISYQAATTQRRRDFKPEAVARARELIYAMADEIYEELFRG
ncbi:hypothetical protein IPM44_00165 [bacterium]|nr:MAG: hypothetical protein IPM44_00165 [bacterium]